MFVCPQKNNKKQQPYCEIVEVHLFQIVDNMYILFQA